MARDYEMGWKKPCRLIEGSRVCEGFVEGVERCMTTMSVGMGNGHVGFSVENNSKIPSAMYRNRGKSVSREDLIVLWPLLRVGD